MYLVLCCNKQITKIDKNFDSNLLFDRINNHKWFDDEKREDMEKLLPEPIRSYFCAQSLPRQKGMGHTHQYEKDEIKRVLKSFRIPIIPIYGGKRSSKKTKKKTHRKKYSLKHKHK